jgi:acyl carrier protein
VVVSARGSSLSRRDIADSVRGFVLGNFVLAGADLGEEDSLIETGVVDSTGVLELVDFLESRFGIEVSDREFVTDNLGSIRQVTTFVCSKLEVA